MKTLKSKVVAAYVYAKKHHAEIANVNIETHLGSILNKFFNGLDITASRQVQSEEQRTNTASRVITHSRDAVKKKERPRLAAPPVESKSLSELKVMAKSLGLKTTGKDKEEVIAMIKWHQDGLADDKKAFAKKSRAKRKAQQMAAEASGGSPGSRRES